MFGKYFTSNTIEVAIEHVSEPLSEFVVYANDNNDLGLDILMPRDIVVPANSFSTKIPLGIKIYSNNPQIGFYLLPRSSTGSKTRLRLSNSVGVIDPSYRGEIIACVDNFGDEIVLGRGERYFQLVPSGGQIVKTVRVVDSLSETSRGDGGFGSTGQ